MKSTLRNALICSMRATLRAGGERGRRLLSEAMALRGEPLFETLEQVKTPRGMIDFYCLGDVSLWRARTLMSKEPETIEWIDGFAEGETFWDIGANVGVYSLYAAIARNIKVIAFEPSAGNYFLLNRNVEVNKLSDWVEAYCIAFSDRSSLNSLNMQSTVLGGALSSFGATVDHFGQDFRPSFKQGMIGYSVDDFITRFAPLFPNHMKIDVDGIEDQVIAGATGTLRDVRLKTISVEVDTARADYADRIVREIEAGGFELAAKRRSEMFDAGPYQAVFNFQFRRKAGGA